MSYYFHEEGVLLAETRSLVPYGFKPNGIGDCVSRTAKEALIIGDPDTIDLLVKLLNERKRWPDAFNNSRIAKSMIVFQVGRLLYNLKLTKRRKYRLQRSVTRDPFTMVACVVYWYQYEKIQNLKVPFWILRPNFYYWKKYLETHSLKHKRKYEKWAKRSIDISVAFGFHGYAMSLNAWRAFIAQSEEVQKHLLPYVPHWNLQNRLLCGDNISKDTIDSYIPHKGYLWNSTEFIPGLEVLGNDEPVYLDKDILYFIYDNKK